MSLEKTFKKVVLFSVMLLVEFQRIFLPEEENKDLTREGKQVNY